MKTMFSRLSPRIRPAIQALGLVLAIVGALSAFAIGLTGDDPLGRRIFDSLFLATWATAPGVYLLVISRSGD